MTMLLGGYARRLPLIGLVAVLTMTALPCLAKSTGVSSDSALESGPCFKALVDRNVSQPTTAPDRELGSACETENGNIDKAWERVQRLWGESSGMPDYGDFAPPEVQAPGPGTKVLAVVMMLLAYVVFGTPMRSAARLMGGGGGTTTMAAAELLAALLVRGLIAWVLKGLLGISYATLLGSMLVVALILRGRRVPRASTLPVAPDSQTKQPGRLSVFAADLINDGLGSAAGLLGLALLAQHDSVLLTVALVLAVAASMPKLVIARRRLRANPLVFTILSALLAAIIGVFALSDPPLATIIGSAVLPTLVVPLTLAAMAFGLGRRHWRAYLKGSFGNN